MTHIEVRHYSFTTILKHHFCEHNFDFVFFFLLSVSCISKGLAMCRLGGVISAQKVLF